MNPLNVHITDRDFLQKLIPQKSPFVMVDKLLYFSGNKIISGFTVPSTNIFASGDRFTEPGLIENMAQTVALHTGYSFYLDRQPAPVGYIGAIKRAEVLSLPQIGSELRTTVEILHDIMGVTLVKAKVALDGTLLATSEMKTILAK